MSMINASSTGRTAALVVIAIFGLVPSPAAAREYGVDVCATRARPASRSRAERDGRRREAVRLHQGHRRAQPARQHRPRLAEQHGPRKSAAGVLNGVYHYARPDNRPTTAGAIQEADHFVATAGSAMNAGHLRPVIDLEEGYFGEAAPLTPTALAQWVMAFVGRVVELKGAAAEPIIYTSTSYASILDPTVPGITDLDAWIVSLNGQNPETGAPTTDGVFNDWTIWQYSHTGSAGGISPLDLNVLRSEFAPLSSIVIPEPAAFALIGLAPLYGFRRAKRTHTVGD